MRSIVDWALDQRILVNLVFVLFILIGVGVYRNLPVDSWPEVSLDEAWIHTVWDGAGADDIERLVTKKIEEEIEDLSGVDRIVSRSYPGYSFIDVKFDEDLPKHDFEVAFNDLRSALDRVQDLPEEAEPPVLRRLTTTEAFPLFSVVVSAADPKIPELVLRETAVELKKALTQVPGVLKVKYQSYRDRELRVLVDRLAARRHGVSLAEIHAALSRTNRSHPAGSLVMQGEGRKDEVRLEFDTDYRNAQEIEDSTIRVYPGRAPLRVRDVARVEFGFEKVRIKTRINGRQALALNVSKTLDSNTITLRDECKRTIEIFAEIAPAGVAFDIVGDQSEIVESRFKILIGNLLQGLVLVSFILLFALGFRNAVIALIGIPFSYLCAFMLFPIFDMSINNLTLFGMVLVGGMLVDDAIIVIENIYRQVESGKSVGEAVRKGTREVAWPVFNACATSIAAMLPLLLQSGVTGRFFAFIPKVVILALLFSVVQCVTVLPVHYLDYGSRRRKSGKPGWLERFRKTMFGRGGELYSHCLGYVLRFRLAFLSVVLGGSLLLVGLVLQIPQDPWISDFNAVFVGIQCDTSYSLEQTEEASMLVERELKKLYEEGILKNYYSIAGYRMTPDGIMMTRPDVAFFMSSLADDEEILSQPQKVVARLQEKLAGLYPYAEGHKFLAPPEVFTPHDGPPLGKPVAVRIECNDYGISQRVAEELKTYLRGVKGVFGVADNFDPGPREFKFRIDAQKASALGLYPADLAVALRAANDGLIVGSFKDRDLDEDVDIRVMYEGVDRKSPRDLMSTDVSAGGRELIPLGDVSTVDVSRPSASFFHYDTRRTVVVTADVDGTQVTGPTVNREMQRVFAGIPERYPGVRLVFGGEFEETTKSMEQQTRSFWIALILIYVVLAAQFRSYHQPLIVMAVVPFGVLGVLLGLYIRDQPFTIPTFIAMIGLAGVVVNDSLLLVEFINLRRKDGLERIPAILLAARQRFRPVLLTATTTMGNLIPLAFGFGGTSRVWTPFAVSIVFGMGVASIMTLFMVPVLYSLLVKKE